MVDRWWEEAERHQVLPLDNRPFSGARVRAGPDRRAASPVHVLAGPGAGAGERGGERPRPPAHDHRPRHDRARPEVAEGVLAVQGSVLGGWSFHLLGDGRLCYVHNLAGWRLYRVEAEIGRLAPGDHTLVLPVRPGPRPTLLVDGEVVGSGTVNRTIWSRFSLTGAGLTAGWSPDLSPADEDYRGRFAFTGTLHRVDIDVAGEPRDRPRPGGPGRHRRPVTHADSRRPGTCAQRIGARSGQTVAPSAAASRAAMSSFFMPSMAFMARSARSGSGSVSISSQPAGHDLPRQAEPVLQPAALALLAAVGELVPVVVDLGLVGAVDRAARSPRRR